MKCEKENLYIFEFTAYGKDGWFIGYEKAYIHARNEAEANEIFDRAAARTYREVTHKKIVDIVK